MMGFGKSKKEKKEKLSKKDSVGGGGLQILSSSLGPDIGMNSSRSRSPSMGRPIQAWHTPSQIDSLFSSVYSNQPGTLSVEIIEVRDQNGLFERADYYCTLEIGTPVFLKDKTAAIKDKEPRFCHQSHVDQVDNKKKNSKMHIQVWEKKVLGTDKLIAEVSLHLQNKHFLDGNLHEGWHNLDIVNEKTGSSRNLRKQSNACLLQINLRVQFEVMADGIAEFHAASTHSELVMDILSKPPFDVCLSLCLSDKFHCIDQGQIANPNITLIRTIQQLFWTQNKGLEFNLRLLEIELKSALANLRSAKPAQLVDVLKRNISYSGKALQFFFETIAPDYPLDTFRGFINKVIRSEKMAEIEPSSPRFSVDTVKNAKDLVHELISVICRSVNQMPQSFFKLFQGASAIAEELCPDSGPVVVAYLLSEYLLPIISFPSLYHITSMITDSNPRRQLLMLAKVIYSLPEIYYCGLQLPEYRDLHLDQSAQTMTDFWQSLTKPPSHVPLNDTKKAVVVPADLHKAMSIILRELSKLKQNQISPKFAESLAEVLTENYETNAQTLIKLIIESEQASMFQKPIRRGSIASRASTMPANPKLAFAWYEILDTEQDYVDSLNILNNDFRIPMIETGLATPEELKPIFSNLDALRKTNEHLLEKLSTIKESEMFRGTGRVFVEIAPWLRVYSDYNPLYLTALQDLLKKKSAVGDWLSFLQETPKFSGSRIHDYLIKPVQRIVKYPLLLKEFAKILEGICKESSEAILKNPNSTEPFLFSAKQVYEMEEERETLKKALAGIEEVCRGVNTKFEAKTLNSNLLRLSDKLTWSANSGAQFNLFLPTRTLRKEGYISLLDTNEGGNLIPGCYFLCNDLFLFTGLPQLGFYEVKLYVFLEGARAVTKKVLSRKSNSTTAFELRPENAETGFIFVDEDGRLLYEKLQELLIIQGAKSTSSASSAVSPNRPTKSKSSLSDPTATLRRLFGFQEDLSSKSFKLATGQMDSHSSLDKSPREPVNNLNLPEPVLPEEQEPSTGGIGIAINFGINLGSTIGEDASDEDEVTPQNQ